MLVLLDVDGESQSLNRHNCVLNLRCQAPNALTALATTYTQGKLAIRVA
jgi:hypothetical protein